MSDFMGHIELATVAPPETAEPVSAESLRAEIYTQLGAASANEIVLEQSWMRLGQLLLRFKNNEHWRKLGYPSFEQFMMELRDKYQRGKTQLWSYLTVAEKLGPILDSKTLEEIGISKALQIKRAYTKSGGKPLPPEIIEAAKLQATTIKEVRALLARAFNFEPDEKGVWFDLDGFFVTPEEKQEFKDCVRMTIALLGIKKDVPDHIQRKEIFLTWMREFNGAHAAEVYGPQEMQNTPATLVLPAGQARGQ